MSIDTHIVVKLLFAILAGGAIGLERELHHKAAGFRTMILICVGATLFTILDVQNNASGRIAANIATGVGFLGAGVIIQEANRIRGVTTAAAVWLSAALGMGIGFGAYGMILLATAVVLVVMRIFNQLEVRLDRLWEVREYQIDFPCRIEKVAELQTQIEKDGLKTSSVQQMKRDGVLSCIFTVTGPTRNHDQFVNQMLADTEVNRIEW